MPMHRLPTMESGMMQQFPGPQQPGQQQQQQPFFVQTSPSAHNPQEQVAQQYTCMLLHKI
ncbi:hypothetical protein ANCCAN_29934 [Ancylostoma caninum]|uniref:Uncharacterized protein n=1 Tax=Ancylostoma caninum TaxID=29170 RepID=A0A368F053_ANCCA|nr:hypothetical protein ANCCAN_29934 [Ancylostoma caninum]